MNIRVLSLFSGLGAFEEALKNVLGNNFELVSFCEKDIEIARAYSLIHGVDINKNLGKIEEVKIESIGEINLVTLGFPCTDISKIGKQQGVIKGQTRSGLLYNALEIIHDKNPDYVIIENTDNWIQDKHILSFKETIDTLRMLEYNCYAAILNSLYFGHAQQRKRTIIVAIKSKLKRKFVFPDGDVKNIRKLKDIIILGQSNDEYYLPSHIIQSFVTKRSEYKERFNIKNIYKDYADTLSTKNCYQAITNNFIVDVKGIRGLTEKECFVLQGFKAEYVDKLIEEGNISKAKIYAMIGNSIPVRILEEIFKNMFLRDITEEEFIIKNKGIINI